MTSLHNKLCLEAMVVITAQQNRSHSESPEQHPQQNRHNDKPRQINTQHMREARGILFVQFSYTHYIEETSYKLEILEKKDQWSIVLNLALSSLERKKRKNDPVINSLIVESPTSYSLWFFPQWGFHVNSCILTWLFVICFLNQLKGSYRSTLHWSNLK